MRQMTSVEPKGGSRSGDGGRPVFGVPTASSIPGDRDPEAYRSEKLLKKRKKKRVQALESRAWWVNKLTRIHL